MIFAAILPGALLALAALALRRAEEQFPDPNDIQLRQGLGHMTIGLISWLALIIFIITAGVMRGAMPLVALIVGIVLSRQIAPLGPRAQAFYRWQTPMAAGALLFGLITLVALIETLQGAFHV